MKGFRCLILGVRIKFKKNTILLHTLTPNP
jgi:hypothetical protein